MFINEYTEVPYVSILLPERNVLYDNDSFPYTGTFKK
jgi:hypothetical protein